MKYAKKRLLLSKDFNVYIGKVLRTGVGNLTAYWPINDPNGSSTILDWSGNGRNGTVKADVTLGVAGFSGTAGVRSGSTVSEGVSLYSTSLRDAFNKDELTLAIWFKANSNIWNFSGNKSLFILRADNNNRVYISKTGTIPTLSLVYTAGGTIKGVSTTSSLSDDWAHAAITVSKANDEVKGYLNGTQIGTTLTGLGTWTGNLANTVCNLFGYSGLGYFEPNGYLSHAAVWNTPLSASEVADLANPFDGYSPIFFAIGDSKTANSPNWADSITSKYPQIINGYPRYAGGGWTTQNVKDGIDSALSTRNFTPQYALINLGANDVNSNPGEVWKTNTAYIVDAIKTKWPNIQVYLTKVWRRNTGSQAVNIAYINNFIDELVSERDWLHVGVNEANILEGGDDGITYTSDGVHPNAAGCELEATAWRTTLNIL